MYHVVPHTEEQAAFLKNLEGNPEIDFWNKLRKVDKAVDIMVSPSYQKDFEEALAARGIEHSVMINDVEE